VRPRLNHFYFFYCGAMFFITTFDLVRNWWIMEGLSVREFSNSVEMTYCIFVASFWILVYIYCMMFLTYHFIVFCWPGSLLRITFLKTIVYSFKIIWLLLILKTLALANLGLVEFYLVNNFDIGKYVRFRRPKEQIKEI